MADVIGAEPVILYGLDSNGVPVPLKLGADGTLSIDSSSGLQLGSTPSTQAMGDAAAGGSATTASKNDHKHGMPSFATPAIVLGTAAAAGAATTPIRSDATILAFDATVPAAVGTAAAGSQAVAARRDHVHNIADQTVTSRMTALTQSTAAVATDQTTTSTSYADLATTGPAITLTPGVTQTHFLAINSQSYLVGAAAADVYHSIAIAGATAVDTDGRSAGSSTVVVQGAAITIAAAQSSGATHTSKYRVSANTGHWLNRRILGWCA